MIHCSARAALLAGLGCHEIALPVWLNMSATIGSKSISYRSLRSYPGGLQPDSRVDWSGPEDVDQCVRSVTCRWRCPGGIAEGPCSVIKVNRRTRTATRLAES